MSFFIGKMERLCEFERGFLSSFTQIVRIHSFPFAGHVIAHVTEKLGSAWEGALAGGGDPATSPLYVFGPYIRYLVAAGAASVVFGTAIWLAVVTVIAVAVVYRLVMRWVVDGSGGTHPSAVYESPSRMALSRVLRGRS